MTGDEMGGWHNRLDGHDFEQPLGVGDGQGSLVCCRPWDCKESNTTEHLNSVIRTLVCTMVSLHLNTLSRFVIVFLNIL